MNSHGLQIIDVARSRTDTYIRSSLRTAFAQVTWVEHVEFYDRAVHNIYKLLVNSDLAFGAKRWVATLDRRCERLASVMANNIPSGDAGVITTPEGRKSMLNLAERMVLSFCSGFGASTAHTWTTLSGNWADHVRVMTRKSMDDPGRPPASGLNVDQQHPSKGLKKAANQAPKIAPKTVGFNYTRAVQGSHVKAGSSQQNATKTAPVPAVNKGLAEDGKMIPMWREVGLIRTLGHRFEQLLLSDSQSQRRRWSRVAV
ncbi:putative homeobox-leucine zipper protein GLAB [Helianthus annuus]|nr:putative homeobox-leucine zipper protein GLAB [Helianthus annuus]